MDMKLYQEQYRKDHRTQLNKWGLDYYSKYPWKKTLVVIKQRCTNPNNNSFKDYGQRGIKCLITSEELKFLWLRDKAYKMKDPTIDRKDNDGNYELQNCEYIERIKNIEKQWIDNDKLRPILQYDLDGNFIREWQSKTDASKALNINQGNINKALTGKYKYCGNFIWRYKNEKY